MDLVGNIERTAAAGSDGDLALLRRFKAPCDVRKLRMSLDLRCSQRARRGWCSRPVGSGRVSGTGPRDLW